MNYHKELLYIQLDNVNKIVVSKKMLVQMYQYYQLYILNRMIEYDFESLNIEIQLKDKVNIYVENYNDDRAMITFFVNEKKIFTIEIEYCLDIGFYICESFLYEDSLSCVFPELILKVFELYSIILFYIQSHSALAIQKSNLIFFM